LSFLAEISAALQSGRKAEGSAVQHKNGPNKNQIGMTISGRNLASLKKVLLPFFQAAEYFPVAVF
jgi:hypothetical protein